MDSKNIRSSFNTIILKKYYIIILILTLLLFFVTFILKSPVDNVLGFTSNEISHRSLETGRISASAILGVILILIVFAFHFEYHQKQKKSTNNDPPTGEQMQLHRHATYISIAIITLSLIGINYTIFSDVFYQHGDPISPIRYSLGGNKTTIDMTKEVEYYKNQPRRLVFLIDISKSVNTIPQPLKTRYESIRKSLPNGKMFPDPPKIGAILKATESLKIHLAYYLAQIYDDIKSDTTIKSFYVTIITFGKYADIDFKDINIKNESDYNSIITGIANMTQSKGDDANFTDYETVGKKLNNFGITPENYKKFEPQRRVVTVLSDFKHDPSERSDSSTLNSIVANLASRSIFFNLCVVGNSNLQTRENVVPMLPYFKRNVEKERLSITTSVDSLDLKYAYWESEYPLTFLVESPFYVKKSQVAMQSGKGSNIVKLAIKGINDNRQQFDLNDSILLFERPLMLPHRKKGDTLTFTGHVPSQFSNVSAVFDFPNQQCSISYEIVFKKKLPDFIARTLVFLSAFLLAVSTLYLFYLIKLLCNYIRSFKKRELFEKENINDNGVHKQLLKDELENQYFLDCLLNSIPFKAFIADKNIISYETANRLLALNKINDNESITEYPTGIKFVDEGVTVRCKLELLTEKYESIGFLVSRNVPQLSISSQILDDLNYTFNTSNGILFRKKISAT